MWPAVDRVIRLNRRERSRETDSGRPSVPVLAAIARTVLLEHPDEQDEGELKELLKCAAVRANLLYDSTSVSDALDRARHQLSRRKDALAC